VVRLEAQPAAAARVSEGCCAAGRLGASSAERRAVSLLQGGAHHSKPVNLDSVSAAMPSTRHSFMKPASMASYTLLYWRVFAMAG